MNDLIACACASAGYSIIKEPIGLFQSRQEAPEPSHARPWQSGKALCWDVTVICPLAESYVSGAQPPGAAAELAASRKEEKYANIERGYVFHPTATETLGVLSPSAHVSAC